MSEWYYIGIALGVTWATVVVYTVRVVRRIAAAESALRELGGGVG